MPINLPEKLINKEKKTDFSQLLRDAQDTDGTLIELVNWATRPQLPEPEGDLFNIGDLSGTAYELSLIHI